MADAPSKDLLRLIELALRDGDVELAIEEVRALDEAGRRQLTARLGAVAAKSLLDDAAAPRAGTRAKGGAAKRGRVVVIHGIMGGQLSALDSQGEEDSIWMKLLKLAFGRFSELAVDEQGNPRDANRRIVVSGVLPEYLPLIARLRRSWDVLPFAFDWRNDVDLAADRLREAIEEWSDEPVHIVAHSMGGLVARRFMQRHPAVWTAMEDKKAGVKASRGGRLIMLGTPNQGSFSIPLTLTGVEPTVRKLASLDMRHRLRDLLDMLGCFVGCYQMLPSPAVPIDDHRLMLFEAREWGDVPVRAALLERGKRFQAQMHDVVDPERLIYVAGYGHETPFRIRIVEPGVFEYRSTLDGDGRVPHELGLLEGVPTFWSAASHGDLINDLPVLDALDGLLATGTSNTDLPSEKPSMRAMPRATGWRSADEVQPSDALIEARLEAVGAVAETAATRGSPRDAERALNASLSPEEIAMLESELVASFVGAPSRAEALVNRAKSSSLSAAAADESARIRQATAKATQGPRVRIEVIRGDIVAASGHVYAAGHYVGVLPQAAEAALDRMVSEPGAPPEQHVIRRLTQRGAVRGELGEVIFLPFSDGKGKLVALGGMGRPGTFGPIELRRLSQNLGTAVGELPKVTELATVLIGSGIGNLEIGLATAQMLEGLVAGLATVSRRRDTLFTIRFAERDPLRVYELHEALKTIADRLNRDGKLRLENPIPEPIQLGSKDDPEYEVAMTLAALAKRMETEASESERKTLRDAWRSVRPSKGTKEADPLDQMKHLADALKEVKLDRLAARLLEAFRKASTRGERETGIDWSERAPTRISCLRRDSTLRFTALTGTAVVPERVMNLDESLLNELIKQMTNPARDDVNRLADLLARLQFPTEFRTLLDRPSPLIIEVDRFTANVHWEMLGSFDEMPSDERAMGLRVPVARQLRTEYSPAPTSDPQPSDRLRALVIGDPGDVKHESELPGARKEAIKVARFLEERNVIVRRLIGPPTASRETQAGLPPGTEPATRLRVLEFLLREDWDILHYCGHGDFEAGDPTKTSGWVFADGLLTARLLERLDQAPRLVVANACLSARTSDRLEANRIASGKATEVGLLPSLADEFFRRGVRNYIGTAWEVDDSGAIDFAEALYGQLVPAPDGTGGKTIGEAMLEARKELNKKENYGALWAAYQHYGDPQVRLSLSQRTHPRGGTRSKSSSTTDVKPLAPFATVVSPSPPAAREKPAASGMARSSKKKKTAAKGKK